jgi:hypothetical protein
MTPSRATLACWRRSAPDREKNARHRLSVGGPDEAFFLAHVRAPGATRIDPTGTDRSPSQERILKVRDHFITVLMGYDAADRRKLAEFCSTSAAWCR